MGQSLHRRPRRPGRVGVEACEPRRLLSAALLKDVNATPYGSEPLSFAAYRDTLFFSAIGPGVGAELFKSSGAPGDAQLVADLNPGETSSSPYHLTVAGDTLYLSAYSPDAGVELWKTDGTAAGTALVKDVLPGSISSNPNLLTAFDGRLFFTADAPEGGETLWKSDGTPAGTVMVKDPIPGPGDLDTIGETLVLGDALYFSTGSTTTVPGRVWKTDGTPEGTVVVAEFGVSDGGDYGPRGLTRLDDRRFVFAAGPTRDTTAYGQDLWVSDGTPAGTQKLKTLNPYALVAGNPSGFVNVGDTVFFRAEGPVAAGQTRQGQELWKTDGTAEGTVLVKDINPGAENSAPQLLGEVSGRLLLAATDAVGGQRLWASDGTEAGTRPLAGPVDSLLAVIDATVSNGALYFTGGHDLWRSDGTEAGTRVVRQFPGVFVVQELTPFRDGVVFLAADGVHGGEPWFSDGTDAGTVMLSDLNSRTLNSVTSPPLAEPVSMGDRAVFVAYDAPQQLGLWITDGTEAGTRKVTGFTGKYVLALRAGRDGGGRFVYAFAEGPNQAGQLWRVDPTGVATLLSPVFLFVSGSPAGRSVVTAGGTVYFAGTNNRVGGGAELYKSDGTAAGTVLVKDVFGGGTSSMPDNLTDVNGTIFFTVANGAELWKSDGTAAGTVRLKRFGPGEAARSPHNLTSVGGTLFFQATSAAGAPQLWKSNGTEAGTVAVRTFARMEAPPLTGQQMLGVGGTVYFEAADVGDVGNLELWKSDGTAAGTVRVADVRAGLGGSNPHDLAAMGGRVYFIASDAAAAAEGHRDLWSTDGTDAGTTRVASFGPLEPGVVRIWGEIGNRLYFTARDTDHGQELWSTDGTAAGTALVEDVMPGVGGSGLHYPVPTGGRVVFFADDGTHGAEPWYAVPPGPPAPEVVGRYVFYNNSAFDGNNAFINAADDAAIAPDKRPLLPGQAPSFANVTSFTRGINGVMIDIANLPMTAEAWLAQTLGVKVGAGGDPAAWADGPRPSSVAIRGGAGVHGSDRVVLLWPDGAIRNKWIRLTLPTSPQEPSLPEPDVFYFGNLVGESGDPGASFARVNALDLAAVRRSLNGEATITSPVDFNRDGRVNALDLAAARANLLQGLSAVVPPASVAGDDAPPEGTTTELLTP